MKIAWGGHTPAVILVSHVPRQQIQHADLQHLLAREGGRQLGPLHHSLNLVHLEVLVPHWVMLGELAGPTAALLLWQADAYEHPMRVALEGVTHQIRKVPSSFQIPAQFLFCFPTQVSRHSKKKGNISFLLMQVTI